VGFHGFAGSDPVNGLRTPRAEWAFIGADEKPETGRDLAKPSDASDCDRPDPVGDLVADVGGGQHRLVAFQAGLVLGATEDSPLASAQLVMDTGVHSKTSGRRMDEGCEVPRLFARTRGVFELSDLNQPALG
jgi:hypothetical protein